MDNLTLPSLDPELIRVLNLRFPERCPDPLWSEREIWMRAGCTALRRTLSHRRINSGRRHSALAVQ
jgi:hypothetical protein